MAYEFLDDNIALMRMLGETQDVQVISNTAAHTGKDFYCLYCVENKLIKSIPNFIHKCFNTIIKFFKIKR